MTSGMCPELMTVSVTCGFRCQCPYQGRGQINEVTARAHLSLLAQVTSLAVFPVARVSSLGSSGFSGPAHTLARINTKVGLFQL